MKFRRLTSEELHELENEFIEFLSANIITGNDWLKLKSEDPDKANDLIDQFSDIVLEKVLIKIKYLELRTPKDWKIFYCAEKEIQLISLSVPQENDLDLTMQMKGEDLANGGVEIYKAEKEYGKPRSEEIFDMIENGCSISNAEVFEIMQNLIE